MRAIVAGLALAASAGGDGVVELFEHSAVLPRGGCRAGKWLAYLRTSRNNA